MIIAQILFERYAFKIGLFLSLLPIFFLNHGAIGQTLNFYDSLDIAKIQLNQGEIKKSLELLDILEKNHPGNEDVIRVKGQALYWNKDFELTKSYFRQSTMSYPTLLWIKLDFGRILFELNELKESQEILNQFLTLQPDHPEALQKLAEINYWTGGKPKDSFTLLGKILIQYPDNESAKKIKKEIQLNTSPRIGIQSNYYSDSQIMEFRGFQTKAEFYHSALLQPGFVAEVRSFQHNASVLIAQASLKSSFIKSQTDLYLKGGFVNSSLWANQEWTYGAEIVQKLPGKFNLTAAVDKEYYLYTLASISQPINPLSFRGSFGRETGNSWMGKVLYQKSVFKDDNWVQTFAAWFLIPILKSNAFQFSVGSAYNNSDSKEIRFSENLPIKNLIGSTPIESVIPGSYNPYFTPINQQIIGGLAKLIANFTPNLSLSVTGNVGFYARIDNPNMIYYGSSSGPGNGQANRPISEEDLYLILVDQEFTPIDLKGAVSWNISQKTALTATYNYQETIFFTSHHVNFGLMISLWNEK